MPQPANSFLSRMTKTLTARKDLLWACLIIQMVVYWAFAFLVPPTAVLVAYQKY
jgi:hypothetical protein